MHHVQGLPGAASFGSATQAVQPSTGKTCLVNPFQVSSFSSAQESSAVAAPGIRRGGSAISDTHDRIHKMTAIHMATAVKLRINLERFRGSPSPVRASPYRSLKTKVASS